MPKTNPKDGCFGGLESRFELFDGRGESSWIAGAVGDEETVMGFWVGELRIPRQDFEFDTTFSETTDLVEFHADIEDNDS